MSTSLILSTAAPDTAPQGDEPWLVIQEAGIDFSQVTLTQPQFLKALQALRGIKDKWILAYSDVVAYGRRTWGDEHVETCLAQLEFDLGDTRRAEAIGQLQFSFRAAHIDVLTPEHMHVLATYAEPSSHTHWAEQVRTHKLSAVDLRNSIECGEVRTEKTATISTGRDSGGLATVQDVVFRFGRWSKQVGGIEGVLQWPRTRKEEFLDQTSDLAAMIAAVTSDLTEEA